MKRLLALLAIVLIGGAYLYGRWPERERRLAVEGEREILQRRLDDAEGRVRLCALLGQLQVVLHAVSLKNYGEARDLSSSFFDAARGEAGRTPEPAFKQALEAALSTRDAVTAALAQGEARVVDDLRAVEARLKTALGHPWPAASPVQPADLAPSNGASPTPETEGTPAPAVSPTPSAP